MGVPIVLGEKTFNRITQNKKINGLKLKAEQQSVQELRWSKQTLQKHCNLQVLKFSYSSASV